MYSDKVTNIFESKEFELAKAKIENNDTIILTINSDEVDVVQAKSYFDMMTKEFPNNQVICRVKEYIDFNVVPDACKNCSNHPSNGGSGICFCTLGTPQVTY